MVRRRRAIEENRLINEFVFLVDSFDRNNFFFGSAEQRTARVSMYLARRWMMRNHVALTVVPRTSVVTRWNVSRLCERERSSPER
jgi:hypothetical protein